MKPKIIRPSPQTQTKTNKNNTDPIFIPVRIKRT